MFSQYHVLERIGEGSFGKVRGNPTDDFPTELAKAPFAARNAVQDTSFMYDTYCLLYRIICCFPVRILSRLSRALLRQAHGHKEVRGVYCFHRLGENKKKKLDEDLVI